MLIRTIPDIINKEPAGLPGLCRIARFHGQVQECEQNFQMRCFQHPCLTKLAAQEEQTSSLIQRG